MTLFRKLRERIAFWRWYTMEFVPMAGGAPDDPPADDPPADDPPKDDPPADDPPADDPPEDDKGGFGKDMDATVKESRKHERRAKQEAQKREALEKRLKAREDADKTESQKALDKAREEGKAEATTEASKARRSDRLEVAVAKRARELADVDDVVLNLQRRMDGGELDAETIFNDEDKVQTDALNDALDDLLESKKHLRVGEAKPQGSADGGKGSGGSKDAEDMTPAEHHEAIRRNKQ